MQKLIQAVSLLCLLLLAEAVVAQKPAEAVQPSSVSNHTRLDLVLSDVLDVRKLKEGDAVKLLTVYPIEIGKDVIPKGATVTGHVFLARAIPKDQKGVSELGLMVDRISWKGGELVLHAYPVGYGNAAEKRGGGELKAKASSTPTQSSGDARQITFPSVPMRNNWWFEWQPPKPAIVRQPGPNGGMIFQLQSNILLLDGTPITIEEMR